MSKPVIAIDGPAGAGKSTVAKLLAKELGLRYLDTGAMYRALALKGKRQNVTDLDTLAALGTKTSITFGDGEPQRLILDGEDVTVAIRAPDISESASAIAVHSGVRRVLVEQQQKLVARGGVVLEGRDVTTVVAPNAEIKVFLTASLEERARRRYEEDRQRGLSVDYNDVRRQMAQRDFRDITRDDSPLSVAGDAHVLESAGLEIGEVVERIKSFV